MTKRTCSIVGCEERHEAKGWCALHYRRWVASGDPLAAPKSAANGERMRTFERLAAIETDECVLWPHRTNRHGYGQVAIDGRLVYVHRLALLRRSGLTATSLFACHAPTIGCQRACMNYRHLRWDTVGGNALDMVSEGNSTRGERQAGHKLTSAQVREIRRLIATGTKQAVLARKFGVTQVSIHSIKTGRTWGWLA